MRARTHHTETDLLDVVAEQNVARGGGEAAEVVTDQLHVHVHVQLAA